MKICKVERCEAIHWGKGFCKIHYRKFRRYGDPLGFRELKRGVLPCTAPQCPEKYFNKGFCKLHYDRFMKHGMTEKKERIYKVNPEERFHQHYKINQENNCWEWIKPLDKHGYGEIWVHTRKFKSHRYSYILHNGEIPLDRIICHRCGNKICVNPEHLYAGTYKDNVADAIRMREIPIGEDNYLAKLTNSQVKEIKIKLSQGSRNCDLANEYKVNKNRISAIKTGIIWKHIGGENDKI